MPPRPDVGPDAGPDVDPDSGRDAGRGPGRVTSRALTSEPWYGVFRVAETPGIVGSTQEITFKPNKRVELGFRGGVTGKWEIFSSRTIRLYDLTKQNGQPNTPTEYTLDPVFENGYLEALQLYTPSRQREKVDPHLVRWRQLGGPTDVAYSTIVGRWQSKKTFTNRNGQRFRIGVRVEQGGEIAYVVVVSTGVTEYSRGEGRIVTYGTGQTMWFIDPPETGREEAPFAGEIRMSNNRPVLYAPRFVNEDGKPGAESYESVELERVMRFQL